VQQRGSVKEEEKETPPSSHHPRLLIRPDIRPLIMLFRVDGELPEPRLPPRPGRRRAFETIRSPPRAIRFCSRCHAIASLPHAHHAADAIAGRSPPPTRRPAPRHTKLEILETPPPDHARLLCRRFADYVANSAVALRSANSSNTVLHQPASQRPSTARYRQEITHRFSHRHFATAGSLNAMQMMQQKRNPKHDGSTIV